MAGLGPLGGDDHHAVGPPCTVDGSRGAVLQDVHGFHLLEVDGADVGIGHAVDYDQRSLSRHEGSGSAEQQLKGCVGVAAVGIGDGKTGDLSLEHSCRSDIGSPVKVVAFQTGY